MEDQRRSSGRVVDVELLERTPQRLYVHRFVDAVRRARGVKGRYLYLRAGDELAIEAAEDGSFELLDGITVIGMVPDEEEAIYY